MTPPQILNHLVVQGFQVRVDGDSLELRGPRDRLTPELRQAVRVSKGGLLTLLRQQTSTATPEPWPVGVMDILRNHVEVSWADDYAQAEREAIQNEAELPPGTFGPYSESWPDDEPDASEKPYVAPWPDELLARTDFYWSQMEPEDREYVLTPPQKTPCFFCGGRTVHSRPCREQRESWILMPWGKHKGKPIAHVPRGYLQWALDNAKSLTGEVADEIRRVLEVNPS